LRYSEVCFVAAWTSMQVGGQALTDARDRRDRRSRESTTGDYLILPSDSATHFSRSNR
jgi:hypothetical protein